MKYQFLLILVVLFACSKNTELDKANIDFKLTSNSNGLSSHTFNWTNLNQSDFVEYIIVQKSTPFIDTIIPNKTDVDVLLFLNYYQQNFTEISLDYVIESKNVYTKAFLRLKNKVIGSNEIHKGEEIEKLDIDLFSYSSDKDYFYIVTNTGDIKKIKKERLEVSNIEGSNIPLNASFLAYVENFKSSYFYYVQNKNLCEYDIIKKSKTCKKVTSEEDISSLIAFNDFIVTYAFNYGFNPKDGLNVFGNELFEHDKIIFEKGRSANLIKINENGLEFYLVSYDNKIRKYQIDAFSKNLRIISNDSLIENQSGLLFKSIVSKSKKYFIPFENGNIYDTEFNIFAKGPCSSCGYPFSISHDDQYYYTNSQVRIGKQFFASIKKYSLPEMTFVDEIKLLNKEVVFMENNDKGLFIFAKERLWSNRNTFYSLQF